MRLYQCDCFFQGAHLPVVLCDKCNAKLHKQGATMKCVQLQNDSKGRCVQCSSGYAGAKAQLSYYERRVKPFG